MARSSTNSWRAASTSAPWCGRPPTPTASKPPGWRSPAATCSTSTRSCAPWTAPTPSITTAAGLHPPQQERQPDIDTVGNRNLADAARRAGVRRFVLTSILTCDQTPDVPHFWHKKLAEDKLEELGVPFVALRPGAFLDQVAQMGGDPFDKRRLMWIGSATIPLTFVLTSDLAGYLADAVDADVEPASASTSAGTVRSACRRSPTSPAGSSASRSGCGPSRRRSSAPPGRVLGRFVPMVKDMAAMFDWFETGRYVADTTRQAQVFGPVPTAEDAVARFITHLGHTVHE